MGLLCTLRSETWRVAGESDGSQDGLDHVWFGDESDTLHLTVTARTLKHLDVEHPAHELGPLDSVLASARGAWSHVGAIVLWFGLGDNP